MLAPGPGESIPLWVVLLGFAAFGMFMLVLFVLLWWCRGGVWKRRSLVLAGVVVLLWGGYRVESEPRWHVNGLSNDSVALFDETSEILKFPLKTNADCPNPTEQITRFRVGLVEGDFGPGSGGFAGAVFATLELAAVRLQEDGWEVGRFQLWDQIDEELGEEELSLLRLNARRDGDYLSMTFRGGIDPAVVKFVVYADECMAEKNLFRLTGTSEVEEFGPER